MLSPPCENLSLGVSITQGLAPPVQTGRGLEQLVHPSAVCSPWLYLLVAMDAGERQVQWWRGLLISAAEGQRSVNLTDPQWQALIYLASKHGFSAPHLRLEAGDEALEVDESDAEGLRVTLGKALEARDIEEITVPGGELDYDTIQRVRHVLRSEGVRLARTRAWEAGE